VFPIHDRDRLFTAEFLSLLGEAGVAWVKLPPGSPNLTAHAERFVRTIKESCLDRMIPFGVSAVRKATAYSMAHYHSERDHQGLDNARICPEPEHVVGEAEVHRRERLGGLLNY
jgi:transposase InsO family protein